MTKEQFEKAMDISFRLDEIEKVIDELSQHDVRISYVHLVGRDEVKECGVYDCCTGEIGKILAKHDNMIRQELQELKQRIESEIEKI